MAVPSKNFTIIADSAIDADSPITEDLMTDFRDNDIHLEEWLGLSYTAAQDHDHDGVNSARVALQTYTESILASTGTDWSFTTGSIGFDLNVMSLCYAGTAATRSFGGVGFADGVSSGGAMSWYDNGSASSSVKGGADAHCIGFTMSATATFTEYGDVTTWASSGVTVTSGTGTWGAGSTYVEIMIWGS